MRGRFGFIGFLLIGAFALLVGSVAYNWGLAAGTAQVATSGTVVYLHPAGFGLGGFLFLFLIAGLVVTAFRARRWAGGPGGPGGWGHRSHGHGGWGPRMDPNDPRIRQWTDGDVPPPFQPMLDAWHRRAHGPADGPGTGTAATSSGAGAPAVDAPGGESPGTDRVRGDAAAGSAGNR